MERTAALVVPVRWPWTVTLRSAGGPWAANSSRYASLHVRCWFCVCKFRANSSGPAFSAEDNGQRDQTGLWLVKISDTRPLAIRVNGGQVYGPFMFGCYCEPASPKRLGDRVRHRKGCRFYRCPFLLPARHRSRSAEERGGDVVHPLSAVASPDRGHPVRTGHRYSSVNQHVWSAWLSPTKPRASLGYPRPR